MNKARMTAVISADAIQQSIDAVTSNGPQSVANIAMVVGQPFAVEVSDCILGSVRILTELRDGILDAGPVGTREEFDRLQETIKRLSS